MRDISLGISGVGFIGGQQALGVVLHVVGIAHAFALKKARPELNFTVLLVQNPRTIIELGLMGLYSKIYETRPDNLVFCPKDPELYPEYNPLYDGVGLRYERNKS